MAYSMKNSCSICGENFSKPSVLWKHKRNIHLKTPSEICQVCGDRFLQKYKLKNHMVLKHATPNSTQKIHICDICDFHTRYFKNSQ